MRGLRILACATAVLGVACFGVAAAAEPPSFLGGPKCPLEPALETSNHRRLALVVGVGEYQNPAVRDLKGPANDARRVVELLTARNGYGFPRENVCLLTD